MRPYKVKLKIANISLKLYKKNKDNNTIRLSCNFSLNKNFLKNNTEK